MEELIKLAKKYNCSIRTIQRWRKRDGLSIPQKRLGLEKAREIRKLANDFTQKELGRKFGVTQAAIGKIINNVSYCEGFGFNGEAEVTFGN